MTFYGSGEATVVPGAWPFPQAPGDAGLATHYALPSAAAAFEPTMARPISAPQPAWQPSGFEPTMARPISASRDVWQPAPELDEPGEAGVATQPEQKPRSAARAFGRAFDWMSISLMGLLVCAFICQQGFGAFRTVKTAAEFPLEVAVAASTTANTAQRYVDHTEWTNVGHLRSLRVYPTEAGRQASVGFVDADDAWAQVVRFNPEANTAGMREQFVCHLRFAELAEPGKVSWNLEPWRPIVNGVNMIESRCNPGGAEEQL